MKRALVTGSDGFIGSHLVKRLKNLGMELVCVDKHPQREGTIQLDVATKEFTQYFRDQPFTFLFHFGAPCSILQFNEYPQYCIENTIVGFKRILNLARMSHARLVYPSSGNVYGSQEMSCVETDIPHPSNMYGWCKLRCELLASHVDAIGLRIFAGYGCGEEMKGYLGSVLYQFLSKMLKNESPVVWGNGFQTRDFIYIDDVIEGIIRSVSLNGVRVLNLASGVSVSYNELIRSMNEVLGTNIIPKYLSKPRSYVERTYANVDRLKKLVGLNPTSLEEGISRFSEHLQSL